MNSIRKSIVAAALAAGMSWTGLGIGIASADVVITPPQIFFPAPQFRFDGGYYRTRDGNYYHYDRDRDGWHYGRTHREGQRYEERRNGRR